MASGVPGNFFYCDPTFVQELEDANHKVSQSIVEMQVAQEAFEKLERNYSHADIQREITASKRHAEVLRYASLILIPFSLFMLCVNVVYGFKRTI